MFEIGQQIVCVDDSTSSPFETKILSRGGVYTIRDIRVVEFAKKKAPGVWLNELIREFDFSSLTSLLHPDDPRNSEIYEAISETRDRPWGARRFRPLKKSEIEHVQKLLEPVDKRELVDI